MDAISTAGKPRTAWKGAALLSLACMVVVMDVTVLQLAVPRLTAALSPTASQLLWIVDAYAFLIAGSMILMGTVGDRIGRKKLLILGSGAFAVASLMAAFSTSAVQLILARAVLGIAGATIAPSTLALIRHMFQEKTSLTRAIALWGTSFSAGAVLGPLVGGLLLQRFWWGSVFLINVPIMILVVTLGPGLLAESRDPRPGRIDLASVVLWLAAALLAVYGLKRIAQDGIGIVAGALLAAGLLLGVLFFRRQPRVGYPLIDVRLFRSRSFAVAMGCALLGSVTMFTVSFFLAQYLQLVLALSPRSAGLWLLPGPIAVTVGNLLSPALARSLTPRRVVGAGFALVAGGAVLLALGARSGSLLQLAGAWAVMCFGIGPTFPLLTGAVVGAVAPERAGAAAALSQMSNELGGALGISLLGSLSIAVYRLTLAVPPGVPADAVGAARNTLASAEAAARHLAGAAGDALVASARSAFTTAFLAVIVTCAVLTLLAAFAAYRTLHYTEAVPGRQAEPGRTRLTAGG